MRWHYLIISALLILGGLALYQGHGQDEPTDAHAEAERPLQVATVAVEIKPMPVVLEAVGTLEAGQSAQLTAQVSGVLEAILFREGETVRTGDPLFRIDARAFTLARVQAEAALSGASAARDEAERQLKRLAPLFKAGYVSEQEFATARVTLATQRARLDQAAAALADATLRLDYATVHAPFAGRVGRALVKPGNLITATSTALVTIQATSPLEVVFGIPARDAQRVREAFRAGTLEVLVQAEGKTRHAEAGRVVFVDHALDTQTGTLTVKAQMDNPDEYWLPGDFVRLHLILSVEPEAHIIPEATLQAGQDGEFVYVVRQDRAEMQPVTVDRRVNGLAVIHSGLTPGGGLAPGEVVIREVPHNLEPGQRVSPEPATPDAPEPP